MIEHDKFFDCRVAGLARVDSVDDLLHLGDDLGRFGQLGEGEFAQAFIFGKGAHLVGVEGEQGADELALVALDRDLADDGVCLQLVFDLGRGHVFAARGLDEVFFAVGNGHEALVVDRSDVAGAQPAVGRQRLLGLFGQVVIALHDLGAAQEDFAVFGDLGLDAGEGGAAGADFDRAHEVAVSRRAGLGI